MKNLERHDIITEKLRTEFLEKRRKNPSYSLRAYAQSLEVDQSLLSKILNRRRKLSPALKLQIGLKLGFLPSEVETRAQFLDERFKRIDDEFELLSEWQHFAILELLKTKFVKHDATFIAARLGLHVTQVTQALTRLERVGFIERQGLKYILMSPNNTWTNTSHSGPARQKLQKELLALSAKALEDVPFEDREHGSLTVAVRKSRMPEFKKKLKTIRQELDQFFQPNDLEKYDEVYQLCISFFPVTRLRGGRK